MISIQLVREEMKSRECKCAVIGVKYRDHEKYATDLKEVNFFRDLNDLYAWWDTLGDIFDFVDRPVNAVIISTF